MGGWQEGGDRGIGAGAMGGWQEWVGVCNLSQTRDLEVSMGWNRREFVSMAVAMSAVVRAAAEEAAPGRGGQGVPPPLHRFIADYMAAMNAPGLTLALANRRGPVAAAFGFVDIAARIPVNPRHRFEIGSITKSFTAIVILQLQDEGKLEVEQPIRKYLPWLPIETDYGEILIHHLLTHSSGMPSDDEVQPADGGQVRQSFKPGTQFHYSNWGYTVLGLLIESIEAMTWGQAVSRRILGPLGMTDTTAIISSADRVRIAQSYAP
jgi:CubicO group peptidase (beta-lactamase class C family)